MIAGRVPGVRFFLTQVPGTFGGQEEIPDAL
jgi:hypothetical protein